MSEVLITGINSFVGKSLASYLVGQGFPVSGTARNPFAFPQLKSFTKWSIEEKIDASVFSGVDSLIHLAWSARPEDKALNVSGSVALFNAARKAGVKNLIFISSMSAHANSISNYGVGKRECEYRLKELHVTIVRPGLVIGHGGGFQNIYKAIKNGRVVPLIDGGLNPVQFIGQKDFNLAMEQILRAPSMEPEYNLAHSEPMQFRDFIRTVADFEKRSIFKMNVNSKLLLFCLSLFKLIGLRPPISPEQVLGYRVNDRIFHEPTLFESLTCRPLIESLRENLA